MGPSRQGRGEEGIPLIESGQRTVDIDISSSAVNAGLDSPSSSGHQGFAFVEERSISESLLLLLKIPLKYRATSILLILAAIALTLVHQLGFVPEGLNAKSLACIYVTLCAFLAMGNGCNAALVLILVSMILVTFDFITIEAALKSCNADSTLALVPLFVVARAVEECGVMEVLIKGFLGTTSNLTVGLFRLCLPIALISTLLNNSPVVAMAIPILKNWSKVNNLPLKRLLIPLSFASQLGGICTILGTSTNLVLQGALREEGYTFGTFDMSPFGFPVMFIGVLAILVLVYLLPADEGEDDAHTRGAKAYLLKLKIKPRSKLVGISLGQSGVLSVPGSTIAYVSRDGKLTEMTSRGMGESHIAQGDDVLVFECTAESVPVLRRIRGLVPVVSKHIDRLGTRRRHRCLMEVVISMHSALCGKTLAEVEFLSEYSAAVLGINLPHTNDEYSEVIGQPLSRQVLNPGDSMLIETFHEFRSHPGNVQQFALMSVVAGSAPPRYASSKDRVRQYTCALLLAAMVICNALDIFPSILVAATLTAFAMVAIQCITPQQAGEALPINLVATICAASGLSEGLKATGVSNAIGSVVATMEADLPDMAMLFVIFMVATILSNVVSSTATVIIMFNVLYASVQERSPGHDTDVQFAAYVYTLLAACSCAFMSPIATSTNLIVYSPGGYQFSDYTKIGAPLTIVCAAASALIIMPMASAGIIALSTMEPEHHSATLVPTMSPNVTFPIIS